MATTAENTCMHTGSLLQWLIETASKRDFTHSVSELVPFGSVEGFDRLWHQSCESEECPMQFRRVLGS